MLRTEMGHVKRNDHLPIISHPTNPTYIFGSKIPTWSEDEWMIWVFLKRKSMKFPHPRWLIGGLFPNSHIMSAASVPRIPRV